MDTDIGAKDLADAENNARTTLAQILGGAFLLGTIYFTWQNFRVTQQHQETEWQTLEIVRQQQQTERESKDVERFNQAVRNVDDRNPDVRLGGVYILGAMASETRGSGTITEILTAFIREHAPWPRKLAPCGPPNHTFAPPPCVDVQAAISVLTGSDWVWRKGLNLSHTDLRAASFGKGLSIYDGQSHIIVMPPEQSGFASGASFSSGYPIDLRGADFRSSNLEGAHLENADLRGADFEGAALKGTYLWNARLGPKELKNVSHLLRSVSTSRTVIIEEGDAIGLTCEQIKGARLNVNSILPSYLRRQTCSKNGTKDRAASIGQP